ncbi:MAG: luciferase family protein [Sandaracinaceae bacterium]
MLSARGVLSGVAARRAAEPAPTPIRSAIEVFVDNLEQCSELAVRPRPIRTVGFYVGGRELGHVHLDGRIDLHLPPRLHDYVIATDRAEHHPFHDSNGWVTHRIESAADIDEAAWLIRAALVSCHLAQRGPDHEATVRELEAIGAGAALVKVMQPSIPRVA